MKFFQEDFIKNLPDHYNKTPNSNNDKIMQLLQQDAGIFKGILQELTDSLDIETASGYTLNLYGEMVGQNRGVATDEQYRAMIKSKISRNLTNADHKSIIRSLCSVFGCEPSEIAIVETDETCVVTLEQLPYSSLNKSNIDAATAIKIIKGLMPAGVRVESLSFTGTFEFATTAPPKIAAGSQITLADCANAALSGLVLYGKTEQSGTPTPESPAPLVSVGDSGSVVAPLAGKNLWDNANATIKYGKSVVTMTETGFDFVRGSYVGGIRVNTTIPIVKGQTVTFSFSYSGAATYCYIYTDESQTKALTSKVGKVTYTATEDYPEATFVVIINSNGTDTTVTNIQVEFGSEVTDYEAFKPIQTLQISTPNGLSGVPVSSEGNYTDENGQQYIADYRDYARRVDVQMIGEIESYSGESITGAFMSSTGELSNGANVLYVLSEPIETPIPVEEMSAYLALHTNDPNTTIYNDFGAHMEVRYTSKSEYVPDYDTEKGFGNEEQTLGGYLGMLSDSAGSNLPV